MAVFDTNLMFKSSGTLTQSVSSSALNIGGTGVRGMAARVVVPSSGGALGTVLPKYYVSDDDSTYNLLATYPGGASTIPTGGKEFITPIVTSKKYVKEELVVADTTPNFGAVRSGLVVGIGYDWSR